MNLKLPVYYNTSESTKLSELGIKPNYIMRDYETRLIAFYHINAVSIAYDEADGNREYSIIHSNGDTFHCPMTALQVDELIEEQQNSDYGKANHRSASREIQG